MKKRWYFIPAAAIIIALLLVGTFLDLNISKAIANPNNGFARFITGATSYPLAFAASFFGASFIRIAKNKEFSKTWQNVLLIVFGSIAIIGSIFLLGLYMTSYLAFNLNRLYSIPIGLTATIPGSILGYIYLDKVYSKKYINYVIFVALVTGIILLVNIGFKFIAPRARYTSIISLGDSYYRPWYLPNLTDEMLETLKNSPLGKQEALSFSSGHSATAIDTLVLLCSLPLFIKKLEGKEWLLFTIGFVNFLFIAVIRIICGAHFLSDMMFAGFLSLFIYFIAKEVYIYKS